MIRRLRLIFSLFYFNGIYVKKDIKQSIYYFLLACRRNYNDSQFRLGLIYFFGWGIQKNTAKGIELLKLAAKNGNHNAELYLGCIYHEGKYVPKDMDLAIHYYKNASSFNNQYAKNNLAIIYKNGYANKNIFAAIEYLEEAVNQTNDSLPMFNLANIYMDMKEKSRNIDKSIDLLIKLANKFKLSFYLLILAIIKKYNCINFYNIRKELSIRKESDELAHKIIAYLNFHKYESTYQIEKSLSFCRKADLLFIYGKIVKSKYLNKIKYFANTKKCDINKYFYEGFGCDLI